MGFHSESSKKLKSVVNYEESSDDEPDIKPSRGGASSERANIHKLLKQFHRNLEKSPQQPLEVAKALRQQGKWLNRGKCFIGTVPGVEVGDIFHYRVELCMIGLHIQMQAGISYVSGEYNKWGIPVASSIVFSNWAAYEDEDKGDVLIYHGVGGGDEKKEPSDQELRRGNLALVNSYKLQIPIRVIRGISDMGTKKFYRYDGLHRVTSYWLDDGPRGNKVYKFFLHVCNAQAPSFSKQEWEIVLKEHA